MDEVQEPYRWTGRGREDKSGPVLHLQQSTEMASTMARTDVAMKKWLSIVGAERSGRTAVSHRHGKFVDILLWTIVQCYQDKPTDVEDV